MSAITHLRFVALATAEFEQSCEFYEKRWRLRRVADDKGVAYFAATGSDHHVLRVRKDAAKRLELLSFAVESRESVDELAIRLARHDVQLASEPAGLDGPDGGYGFRCFDPDGRLVEISADSEQGPEILTEPGDTRPVKLSHAVVNTPNMDEALTFYTDLLGFRVSDWMGDMMVFLRCREQHHVLALFRGPHASLNHVSYELRGLDEFMYGAGRLVHDGEQLVWGPGRHGIGDISYAYFLDPNGLVAEYVTDLVDVNEATWSPKVWKPTPENNDAWGFGGNPSELTIKHMLGSPDPAPWQPAPL